MREDQRLAMEQAIKDRSRYLEEWFRDYNRRKNTFLEKKQEVDREWQDFREKNRALAGQSRFTVTLADGQDKSAILYRISERYDLALLKLNGYQTPYLEIADSSSVRLGQQVFAIGAPLRLKNSVTSGVISNLRGEYVQTSAEIYPGNSGGPLITADGKVVGVNTMKLITEKFEGIGFAIHINRVLADFSDFFSSGRAQ
jgi:serine protease Do